MKTVTVLLGLGVVGLGVLGAVTLSKKKAEAQPPPPPASTFARANTTEVA
jgi:hypothetical protein